MPDVDGEELEQVLEFVYKGEVSIPAKKYQRFCQISKSLSIGKIEGSICNGKRDQEETCLNVMTKHTTESSSNICILPLEILTKILSQLTTYDLLHNVALVSKQFYGLTKSPSVHLVVTLCMFVGQTPAAKFLKQATLMRELHICRPAFCCWNSKSVDFDESNCLCDKFLIAVKNHQHLQVITSTSKVSSRCFSTLGRWKCWTNLKKIVLEIKYLWRAKKTFEKEMASTVRSLMLSENLEHLGISSLKIEKALEDVNMASVWKNVKVLETFSEEELLSSIKPETVEEIILSTDFNYDFNYERFQQFKKLKVLKLDVVNPFFEFVTLSKFTHLKAIEIGGVNFNNILEQFFVRIFLRNIPKRLLFRFQFCFHINFFSFFLFWLS